MKIAPAIITGNSVIVKPSPTTPLTTLALAALAKDALPEGLLQVVGDDGSIGPALVRHPRVAKISFTGSTATGRAVMASAASNLTRVTLELGGNDAAIVLADADIELTAAGIFQAAFTNAGQICGAIKRVFVDEAIFDEIAHELGRLVTKSKVGNGLHPDTTIGPVQNEMQFRRALALRKAAEREGRLVAEAAVYSSGQGYFVSPAIFEGLDDEHPLVAEEQFAPLLPLMRFRDEEEAVFRANNSEYALTASVWSADTHRARLIAARLEASLICLNAHNRCPSGVGLNMAKDSGVGWLLGEEGIKEYVQTYALVGTQ
jgi:acyl-CoA reductase-like NAD-dependent aldehyde dehydrogenase